MTDAFDALRLPDDPLDPPRAFAETLRARVTRALGFATAASAAAAITNTATPRGTTMARTPSDHQTVTAYLCCKGASDALAFYVDVFGAQESGGRYVDQSDGRLGHAEFVLGDTRLMLSDEYPEYGAVSPETLGGSPIMLTLYVDDVDAVYAAALARGARGLRPPEDQPYGSRMGSLLDPWGHRWSVQTLLDGIERPIEGFDLVTPSDGA